MNDYTNLINEGISSLYKSLESTLFPFDMKELANEAHKEQRCRSGLPYILLALSSLQSSSNRRRNRLRQDGEHLTLHMLACLEAIRLASQYGNYIHEAELPQCPDCLYTVKIMVRAVDHYHLITNLIEYITEKLQFSMTVLSSESVDNIGTYTIDFRIYSVGELLIIIKSFNKIEGVDEDTIQQKR